MWSFWGLFFLLYGESLLENKVNLKEIKVKMLGEGRWWEREKDIYIENNIGDNIWILGR